MSQEATCTRSGLERCVGIIAVMVLRDLAQKDWAESSRGELHLLSSGSQQLEFMSRLRPVAVKDASATHKKDIFELLLTRLEPLNGESWQAGGGHLGSRRTR